MNMFQEAEGVTSIRRVLAAFFAVSAIPLGIIAIPSTEWFAFIPCGGCLVAVLMLLFFTTWSDVAGAVAKIKGP